MKNIFKKNQIIITALAIMIVIAGYLSFTNDDTPKNDANTLEATNPDSEDYDIFTELEEGTDVATETGTDADVTGTEATDADVETDTTDVATEDADADVTVAEDSDETTPVASEDASEETADISDEDILDTAQDVADNGELNLDDGVPGEAVLANAARDSSFFISTKIEREQTRAMSKDTLMDVIGSTTISEEAKQEAIDRMIELTDIAEKENATEMLLEAKGFDGAVVFIVDGEADVVVNAETLSDQQLAIIESVVKDKTDISAKHITINPVVVTE
ncbi:MAG: putative rane protein [Herbinix sp.]|jgi:stage III sporulation protein AH|nr:putative rane protein [Herbinix sp.]